MQKTNIHYWIAFSVAALVITASVAVVDAAKNRTLYRGTETLEKTLAPMAIGTAASVLNAKESQSTLRDFSFITKENAARLAEAKPEEERIPETLPAMATESWKALTSMQFAVVYSECVQGSAPIIVNGTLGGCTGTSENSHIRPVSTCEQAGKQTYRGADQPGLIYGMCI